MKTKTGTERFSTRAARVTPPRGGGPFDGARVTDDPVKIARIRYRLALEALIEIRPWHKDERDLGRRVFDIAAGELDAAIAAGRPRGPAPVPGAEPPRPRLPPLPRPAVANGLLGGIVAGG